MNKAIKKALHAAVEEYTERLVDKIDVVQDPCIATTYAIRAHVADGDVIMFLHGGIVDPEDVESMQLEEVTFTSWPPNSSLSID